MGYGDTSYIWHCCECGDSFDSILVNDHCSRCFRKKCRNCEVVKVKPKRKGSHCLKVKRVATADAQPHSEDEPKDLEVEPPRAFRATPFDTDDLLVSRAMVTRPDPTQELPISSTSSSCIDPKHTGIQEWLDSVEQRSSVKSCSIGSPSECLDMYEAPEGDDPAPVSDISISTNSHYKEHSTRSGSTDRSLSHNMDATAAIDNHVLLYHSSWLDPLLRHPLYSTIVKAWAEFCSENLVDQGSSNGNTEKSTPSSSGSTPNGESEKQPSDGSKRKRQSSNKDESGDAKKVKLAGSNNRSKYAEEQSRLACHFYKMNPRQHWECMRYSSDSIGHAKQHLQKDHKLGPNHCKDCWAKFAGEVELRQHPCNPTGGKPVDQLPAVPKRQLDTPSKWYWIWDHLFPKIPRPATPYYTEDATEDVYLQRFFDFAEAQNPSLSSAIPEIRAAAQVWFSTPAHTLNVRQLPTPATTVTDDEMRTSPAALQTPSESASTSNNPQPSEFLENGPEEGAVSSISLGSEDLLYQGQPHTETIAERVEAVQTSSLHIDGIDAINSAEIAADYDAGVGFVALMEEVINSRAWNSDQAFGGDPSDGTFDENWFFDEGVSQEEENTSASNPEQDPEQALRTGSLDDISLERWAFAEGMSPDDHLRMILDFESIAWKDEPESEESYESEESPKPDEFPKSDEQSSQSGEVIVI